MNNLKRLRQQKNYTQKHMADSIGVNLRSYSRYESDTEGRIPTLDIAIRIADVLEISDLRTLWPRKD